ALHHLDFRQAGALVADDSVDLIFTDPPYAEEHLPLYGDLGKFAARVLRPGGWLLAYAGHAHLPLTLSLLEAHLTFFWEYAVVHADTKREMRYHQLRVGWKPVVAFYKPPAGIWWDIFLDTVSGGREKDAHPWQQSVGEAEYFLRHLCPEGGLVCDPFAGSGTTLIAAERLGRKHIGFEINPGTAERARQRIAEARKAAASGAEIR